MIHLQYMAICPCTVSSRGLLFFTKRASKKREKYAICYNAVVADIQYDGAMRFPLADSYLPCWGEPLIFHQDLLRSLNTPRQLPHVEGKGRGGGHARGGGGQALQRTLACVSLPAGWLVIENTTILSPDVIHEATESPAVVTRHVFLRLRSPSNRSTSRRTIALLLLWRFSIMPRRSSSRSSTLVPACPYFPAAAPPQPLLQAPFPSIPAPPSSRRQPEHAATGTVFATALQQVAPPTIPPMSRTEFSEANPSSSHSSSSSDNDDDEG